MTEHQGAKPDPATAEVTPDPEARRLLYDELRHRHDVQRGVSERLEGKAALVLGAALALVQFVAREPVDSGWWLPAALAAYLLSAAAALRVVLPRRFEELGAERVLRKVWWWSLPDTAGYLSNARRHVIELNVDHLAFKVRWLRVSIGLLIAAAILSAVHLTQGERDERERSAGAATVRAAADAGVDPGA
jgi:hypothetical protein